MNSKKTEFLEIGQNPYSPYVAYGDDSVYEEILLYGFVICKRHQVSTIERAILNLKKEFGIPHNIPIHMKNLLSGQYRRKHGISGLDRKEQAAFFRKVIDIINKNKCVVRYSFAKIPESGKLLPEASSDGKIQFTEDHKAFVHQMAGACFFPYVERGKIIFTLHDFEIFLSQDSTKTKAMSCAPNKQAHFWSEVLVPLTHPPRLGSYARVKPKIQLMKDNIFLQLADIVVYILSHSLSEKGEQIFKYQANRIKFFIRHTADTETSR